MRSRAEVEAEIDLQIRVMERLRAELEFIDKLPQDVYGSSTVLQWNRTFGTKTYLYVAIKSGERWWVSGKNPAPIDGMTWTQLWDKYLQHANGTIWEADGWKELEV